MAQETSKLKKWMRKEDIYDNDLFDILTGQGVNDPEADFKGYTQKQWDELWRRGCVERAKELKDQKAKVRLESMCILYPFQSNLSNSSNLYFNILL